MYGWDVLITYLVRSGEKSSLKNIQKEKTVIKKKTADKQGGKKPSKNKKNNFAKNEHCIIDL